VRGLFFRLAFHGDKLRLRLVAQHT
jgi:hypothetical protein